MSWLVLSWFLTIGYVPAQEVYIIDHPLVYSAAMINAEVTEFGVAAEAWGFLRAWGSMEIYALAKPGGITFMPYRADFIFGAEIFYGPFSLKIEHECDHPVVSFFECKVKEFAAVETRISLSVRGETRT